MATTIVLVRHGETDWNRDNRFQGHADIPLNDAGREQARALAGQLADKSFAAVYTSPLQRAAETARIIADSLDLEVRESEALREVDVGSWSGLTRTEVEAAHPEGFGQWLAWRHGWTDGETYDELGLRVLAELSAIAAAHASQTVLAVTHGGPIRSALAAAAGIGFEDGRRSFGPIGNCAVVRVAVRDGVLEAVADRRMDDYMNTS